MQRNINPHFLRYWVLCLWQQKTVKFGKSFSIPLIWLSYSNLTLLKDPYNQSFCSSNSFKRNRKKKDDDNDADSILVSDTGNTELMYCAASGGVRHTYNCCCSCWYRTYIRKICRLPPVYSFFRSQHDLCSLTKKIQAVCLFFMERRKGKFQGTKILRLVQNIHSENMLIASCAISFPYSPHSMNFSLKESARKCVSVESRARALRANQGLYMRN